MTLFGVLSENWTKFWSKWWFQINLSTQMIVFSNLKKNQKCCLEILKNFSKKFQKYTTLFKFEGSPPKIPLIKIYKKFNRLNSGFWNWKYCSNWMLFNIERCIEKKYSEYFWNKKLIEIINIEGQFYLDRRDLATSLPGAFHFRFSTKGV